MCRSSRSCITEAEKSHHPDESVAELDLGLPDYVVWPFDVDAAKRFGRIKATLKRKGITMQDADLQLAAVALTLGNCTVVSTDSDLTRVPGLAVENWAN